MAQGGGIPGEERDRQGPHRTNVRIAKRAVDVLDGQLFHDKGEREDIKETREALRVTPETELDRDLPAQAVILGRFF